MKRRLGEILVDSGLLSVDELQRVLEIQQKRKMPLGKLVVELNLLTEHQISEALSEQTGFPYINLSNYAINPDAANSIPGKIAERFAMVPFDFKENRLLVAAADPLNLEGLDVIRQISKRELEIYFATEDDIQFIVNRFYGQKRLDDNAKLLKNNSENEPEADETILISEDVPVVKFINELFSNAFRDRASDIHIEPTETELRIRFRIDGSLYEVMSNVPLTFHSPIISRIKVMANLDIAEKRIPQDGRVPIEVDGKKADLRVSIIPSNFGEKAVLRLLYKQQQFVNLENLGMLDEDLNAIYEILKNPYGLIYVSGPTGSGKTTTLYSCLNRLNTVHKNLLTLEDPIEYIISGVTQVNVNPKVGLTFANGLRSFLRQDPDIIMVGETRDEETAHITVQASLTGHLVLSTIHTNDAIGVINRLLNMNIEPYLIGSALIGVIAQRLVRKICPKCKEIQILSEAFLINNKLPTDIQYYRGHGCEFCQNTGFKGRTGIYEIMKINDQLRELISIRASQQELTEAALNNGMRFLYASGLELVRRGVTTIDEVLRVTAFR